MKKKKKVITEQSRWYTQNDNFLKDASNFFQSSQPSPKNQWLATVQPLSVNICNRYEEVHTMYFITIPAEAF